MRLLRFLTPFAALAGLVAGSAAASAASSSLAGATLPNVPFRDLGEAPATPIHLAVVLKYRHADEMHAMSQRQAELLPGYRVLTAQQFRDYFSPASSTYAYVESALTRLGLHVERVYSNRTVLDVEAPAAVVDRAFATTIHAVMQQPIAGGAGQAGIPGGLRYANLRPAIIPAQLRPFVADIFGFNDLVDKRPMYVRSPSAPGIDVKEGPPLKGPNGGYGPFAFVQGYQFPVQFPVRGGAPGQTYDGTGQATANVIDSDFHDTDLSGFLSYFGITRTGPPTTRVMVDGGAGINGDEIETDLDVETIVGTSPGTALYVYLIPSLNDKPIIDAYNQIVSDDLVDAANSSFGGCENLDFPFASTTDEVAEQGTLLGINFSASTGDYGSRCPGGTGVNAPASGPHFLALGGTTYNVDSNGQYKSETCWSGSGGGVSQLFYVPSYQYGVAGVIEPMRNIPDVAFDANPITGAALYLDGGWSSVGGTSLASPLMTSLVTQFDQFNGARYGDLHPLIWHRFRVHGYQGFDGLTVFHTINPGGGNGDYQCTTGYDQVTGIGSIDGAGGSDAYRPGAP